MSATPLERATLDELTKAPYIRVLTYPKISLRSAKSRIAQLRGLKVDQLIFEGRAKIGRLGILGLGTVGLVVRAEVGGEVRALKIRRTDANRPSMDQEAAISSKVNRLGIGPQVYGHSKDFILMQLLVYQELDDWLRGLRGRGTREAVRELVHAILNQSRKLDIMGIDHGQLSNLRKHAVVSEGKPWIIDFESAGTSRRPRNVTSAAQYLLIGGKISPRMRRMLGIRSTATMIKLLSRYKGTPDDYTYAKILEYLRVSTKQ